MVLHDQLEWHHKHPNALALDHCCEKTIDVWEMAEREGLVSNLLSTLNHCFH